MPRYRKISDNAVQVGDRIRLTAVHYAHMTGTARDCKIVWTGPVVKIHTRPSAPIMGSTPPQEVVSSYELPGETLAYVRQSGWDCLAIEVEMPDLPTKEGAVIKTDSGLAAVLTEDAEGNLRWVYSNDLDYTVPAHVLDTAVTLHHG